MKTTYKFIFGITALAVAGMIIYGKKSRKTGQMLAQVADEGYETAFDVLFPDKSNTANNLRYGPVLP